MRWALAKLNFRPSAEVTHNRGAGREPTAQGVGRSGCQVPRCSGPVSSFPGLKIKNSRKNREAVGSNRRRGGESGFAQGFEDEAIDAALGMLEEARAVYTRLAEVSWPS